MDFRLLGPLEVLHRGSPVRIAAGKQRALLGLLLLNANTTVPRDQIVDGLWGDDAPGSARKMVQIFVSQLRKALPEPRIHTRQRGYAVEVADGELDLHRFEQALVRARRALADGDPATSSKLLTEALASWHGGALAEFSEPFARHDAARLEELRFVAIELRIDAELADGHHRDVVGELEALIAQHPFHEHLRRQHMLALYGSGRHAEALAGYAAFRRLLSDELGIEPSSSLRDLERRMLQHDASLAAVPDGGAAPARRLSPAPAVEVAYARSRDIRIAYQVVGDGALDLVLVHGWVCTFQPGWEYPRLARFYRRLASMGRLILFDKRGTGLSDRVSPERLPDLETRMDDVRAVMDAAQSERAVVIGIHEGGAMSTLFAATHPERTRALVLLGTFARMLEAPDYPIGIREDDYRRRLDAIEEDDWVAAVTTEWLTRVGPLLLLDPEAVRWYTSYVQRGASPAANTAIRVMNAGIDVRNVLPTIKVPTLVLYRANEYFGEGTRFMGEHIPGAQTVELPGSEHLPWEGDQEALLLEIERFLDGVGDEAEPDGVLATLLCARLEAGVDDARGQVARFRGSEVDGGENALLATFDGPARAVRCASAIVGAARDLGVEARAGVHAGEIYRTGTGIGGAAVDVARAIAATARPGEVLVSSTVKDLVAGSGIAFDERRNETLLDGRGSRPLFALVRT